jgi:hypothetical protein
MVKSKKILAFVLLLIVATPIFFFTCFLVKQKLIQYEMKERLESSLLQTIIADQSDVKWVKKNKEVIIGDRLFDVKFYTIENNQMILTGLYDDAEKKLKKDFAGMLHQKKNESAPLEQLILKFIFTAAIKKTTISEDPFFSNYIGANYLFYNEVAVAQSHAVTTPPPNV